MNTIPVVVQCGNHAAERILSFRTDPPDIQLVEVVKGTYVSVVALVERITQRITQREAVLVCRAPDEQFVQNLLKDSRKERWYKTAVILVPSIP